MIHPRTLALAVCLAAPLLVGCKPDTSGLETLSVDQVASLIEKGPGVSLCDANNKATRSRWGVLSGAILLTNYRDYDPGSELPADTASRLIFYCYNDMCGAAAEAANKAIAAGYKQVSIMPDGIEGWVGAEHPVERAAAS